MCVRRGATYRNYFFLGCYNPNFSLIFNIRLRPLDCSARAWTTELSPEVASILAAFCAILAWGIHAIRVRLPASIPPLHIRSKSSFQEINSSSYAFGPSSIIAIHPSFPILSRSSSIDIPIYRIAHTCYVFPYQRHEGTNHADVRTWVIYSKWSHLRPRSRDCWLMQCTPKMPSPCLHPCAMLSKCNRSYTNQRIIAFPSLLLL